MKITPLEKTGNSSKFVATLSKGRGEFMISLSFTLCQVWGLQDEAAKLDAAAQMAEALVGRHDPRLPFRDKYIFGEHNTAPTLAECLVHLRKVAL